MIIIIIIIVMQSMIYELLQTKFREASRPSKLLSDCMTFRRTMTQLRKQTLNLVKVLGVT